MIDYEQMTLADLLPELSSVARSDEDTRREDMTVITLATSVDDANLRVAGFKRHDIRPKTLGIKEGDTIKYEVYYKQKKIPHPIDDHRYMVIYTDGSDPRVMEDHMIVGMTEQKVRFI